MKEGKAEFVPVRVGIAGERYFEVETGLTGGETVIAGPYSVIRDLQDGDPVRITRPETESAEGSAPGEGP